jgi:serine/threonine-protein kinase RsbW
MPPMRMTKPATTGNLALFLGFVEYVAERHDLPLDVAQRLKLVVEEAVTNVVHHGYAGREPGDLTLGAELDGETVEVTLEDRGHAFDPADAPAADVVSELDARRVGGLGWHLIKELSERVDYAAGDPATGRPNRLTLRVGPSHRGGPA